MSILRSEALGERYVLMRRRGTGIAQIEKILPAADIVTRIGNDAKAALREAVLRFASE